MLSKILVSLFVVARHSCRRASQQYNKGCGKPVSALWETRCCQTWNIGVFRHVHRAGFWEPKQGFSTGRVGDRAFVCRETGSCKDYGDRNKGFPQPVQPVGNPLCYAVELRWSDCLEPPGNNNGNKGFPQAGLAQSSSWTLLTFCNIFDEGSLEFRMVRVLDSPTCWGYGVKNPNKFGSPIRQPCKVPETLDELTRSLDTNERRVMIERPLTQSGALSVLLPKFELELSHNH